MDWHVKFDVLNGTTIRDEKDRVLATVASKFISVEVVHRRARQMASTPLMRRAIKRVLAECKSGQYAELPKGTIVLLQQAISAD